MTSETRGRPQHFGLTITRLVWTQRWVIAIVALVALALLLTFWVRTTDLLPGESAAARYIYDHSGSLARDIADVLELIADTDVAPILYAVLMPVVWWAWGRYAFVTFLLVGALTAPLSLIDLASRPRPGLDLEFTDIVVGKGSYPSGHVLYVVLVFGIFAFLSTRYGAPTRRRTALVWSLVAVIVLMGPSRLVKLAHWPADVLFSYLMGGALVLGAIWLHQRLLPWLEPRIPRVHSILTADGRYRRWLTK